MKRGTLAAAAVLVLLGGYVYWLEREDPDALSEEALFQVTAERITRVFIEKPDAETVVVARTEDGFALEAPLETAADASEVELLLENLQSLAPVRRFAPEDGGLESYGLDPARLAVRFETDDGGEHGIRFGDDTLTPSSQYAQRIGEADVLVVADHLYLNLGRSAWDLRDKRVFPGLAGAELESLTLTRGGERFVIRRDESRYAIEEPIRARGDSGRILPLVNGLLEADMVALAESEEGELGLESPEARVELAFGADGPEPTWLEVGAPSGIDVYARASTRAEHFVLDGALAESLTAPATSFVDGRLLPDAVEDGSHVRITGPDGEVVVAEESAAALTGALRSTSADRVEAGSPAGDADYVIEVEAAEGGPTRLAFFADSASVRRDEETVLLRLPEAVASDLGGRLKALFSSDEDAGSSP